MSDKSKIESEIVDPLIHLGQKIARLEKEEYNEEDILKLRRVANYVLEKINEL